MQVTKEQINPTKLKLNLTADTSELQPIKDTVLKRLGGNVKVSGFRSGKAPQHLIEKQLDPTLLQSEFLEQAVNHLYAKVVDQEKLRPVAPPQVAIRKFVPFTTLEFSVEVEAVGEITLPDYKKIKLAPKKVEVSAQDVNTILNNLRDRAADKEEVKRPAKLGDEMVIDFAGQDAETKEPIEGADGKEYPLVLGSKTFIPGFEDELVGLKPGAEKTFALTFPKTYGVKALQSRKVNFTVTVCQIQELKQPKLDDAFAATVGPFKNLQELKSDIKKQLTAERQQETWRAYDNELLEKISAKTTVAIPTALIDEEINRLEDEERRNLAYRGQTWQEHLTEEGITAEEHREQKRGAAQDRIKAGLALGEIAEREEINVTPEELEIRIQLLKGQYPDPAMQAELEKSESRRDILSRMMTEKTLDKLRSYASQ